MRDNFSGCSHATVASRIIPSLKHINSGVFKQKRGSMIGDLLLRGVSAFFFLLWHMATGAVGFIVMLLGPGLTAILVASVAALWWFGWLPW